MDTLENIVSDAASLSISYTSTFNSSTTVGLGTDTGRAIMALGSFALRGAEKLNIQVKLRLIARRLRSERPEQWSESMIEDLLELQRICLYPENVRLKSWELIIEALAKGGCSRLSSALNLWGEHPVEVELFHRQLALCRLHGWSVQYLRTAASPAQTDNTLASTQQYPAAPALAMLGGMSRIYSDSLQWQPAMLHGIFSLDTIARILAETPQEVSNGSTPPLEMFFASLSLWYPFQAIRPETLINNILPLLPTILDSYPAVECFLQFLCTGHLDNLTTVVNYILSSIKPVVFVNNPLDIKYEKRFRQESITIIHPAWPALCFATFLAYKHREAARLFLSGDLTQTIKDLHAFNFTTSLGIRRANDATQRAMYLVCYLTLGAIAEHQKLDDTASKIWVELGEFLSTAQVVPWGPQVPGSLPTSSASPTSKANSTPMHSSSSISIHIAPPALPDSDEEDEDEDEELWATPPTEPIPLLTFTPVSERTNVLIAFLSSERSYASELAVVRNIFLPLALGQQPPLLGVFGPEPSLRPLSIASEASSVVTFPPLMTTDDAKVIFNNLADIAAFADMFSERLEGALGSILEGGSGEDYVGALLLELIPVLEPLYTRYNTRILDALMRLKGLPQSPSLTAYLARTQQLSEYLIHTCDLQSLLSKPVQRLLRYPLILGSILDQTPTAHGDRENVLKATERMKAVTQSINEGRKRREAIRELLAGRMETNLGRIINSTGRAASSKVIRPVKLDVKTEQVVKMGRELQACRTFLKEFSAHATLWVQSITLMAEELRRWSISFGEVIGISEKLQSEALDEFQNLIEEGLLLQCESFKKALEDQFLVQLGRLTASLDQPERLLEIMRTLEPLYNGLLQSNSFKARRRTPEMLQASRLYIDIREQLFIELPHYLQLLDQGIIAVLREFVSEQGMLWLAVKNRWTELFDALHADGDSNAAGDTVAVWWSRFADIEACVFSLNIVRKPYGGDVCTGKEKQGDARRKASRAKGRSHTVEAVSSKSSIPSATVVNTIRNLSQSSGWSASSSRVSNRHAQNQTPYSSTSSIPISSPMPLGRSLSQDPIRGTSRYSFEKPLGRERLRDKLRSASTSLGRRRSPSSSSAASQYQRPPSASSATSHRRRSPSWSSSIFKRRRSPSSCSSVGSRAVSLPQPSSSDYSAAPLAEASRPPASPAAEVSRPSALYACQVVHPCIPPDRVSYQNVPFFALSVGDVYDILQDAGHPSLHWDLPLYVDDDEDCLLLVRNRAGDIGWALASFLLPVD